MTDLLPPSIDPSAKAANPQDKAAARLWAFVPCAGVGARAVAHGARPDLPKQYQPVAGQPLVLHTLAALAGVTRLAGTLVGVAAGDSFFLQMTAAQPQSWTTAPCGGPTRAETVLGGLAELKARGADDGDWVLVHDAARCLLTPAMVDRLIDACLDDPVGGLLALALPDTLKSARSEGGVPRVAATLERSDKWLAQTPQMFRLGTLRAALGAMGAAATDEASAIEASGRSPRLVAGSAQNFKVTYPEDFALAEAVLQARARVG
ncbi:2-C-methyl-D-erythritol 4-phosphate cytidylyltransferase [Comamonas endophytica]|uniref:2-C-methyl-D-erythritol 4-phosphate cytidylyltransferase n=1 Tax=Comamonas endophytica TaxID=2949090 RepID=A0ABY6GAF1_9BURK|nr:MULTISPECIES: 2-C-methyl-D-erythritol 4-phosphate cytidylyltransferase [unclassified Acidovorax]MCD2514000.1 2-C-methyl-D-erythritol 4-phosphate cytidylyltransferase [Acidovorax sp. D4N7]UYG52010.1 2-C-methyl-D-erythritol 4-phosphate cytidylyltransferase [Acidovorax sp. 5MLIR]